MFRKLKRVETLRKTPKNDAIFHIKACRDKAGLDVKYINSFKGRGVFAMSSFTEGEFVLECRGQLINLEESQRRKRICHKYIEAFMFDFLWHGKLWTIDAGWDDGTLGRLVNDDHINPNCKMKRIFVNRKPHLCLFALRDITHGEEITYKYRYAVCPWRTQIRNVAKCETDPGPNCMETNDLSVKCTKSSQHKSPSHIQDQASSESETKQFISTNLPCNKLENQQVKIVPAEPTQVSLQQIRGVKGPNCIIASFIHVYREKITDQTQSLIIWNRMVPLQRIPLTPNILSTNLLLIPRPQKAYITTQNPLTEITKDLCRMLSEQNSTTKDGLSRRIRQFQITDWPKQGLLGTGDGFDEFIGQVHETEVQFNHNRPVTVHYSVRVSRTESVTFSIVLERMRDAEMVDLL